MVMSPWWSRQLEELIDAPGLERELRRGRRYAEEGRVTSLDVASGRVSALIAGTRPEPYRVHLDTHPLTDARWEALLGELFAQPGAWLALKAGLLPPAARQWALVPREPIELDLQCSCPVRDLFCKHTAATIYALAARAAEEPMLILQWRGRSRHAIESAWSRQTHRQDGVA
jgi:uncharacterized Zn finger protein